MQRVISLTILVYLLISPAFAATTTRICTQNLERVGKPAFGKKKLSVEKQTQFLVERIKEAECDVIAVQEVFGRSKIEAEENLRDFTLALSDAFNDRFVSFVGESQHDEIRNGFIIRERFARLISIFSTEDYEVPKLNPLQRSRSITRKPLAILLDVAETKRDLLLVNIHLKSKARGFKDPTGLEFETLRMEGAEQVRDFALGSDRAAEKEKREVITLILGDRNSRPLSPTDEILMGRRPLKEFRSHCQVTADLRPECGSSSPQPISFQPLLSPRLRVGSTKHRGREELIDEIYVESQYLDSLALKKLELDVGAVGEFNKGSDHRLLWIDLPL